MEGQVEKKAGGIQRLSRAPELRTMETERGWNEFMGTVGHKLRTWDVSEDVKEPMKGFHQDSDTTRLGKSSLAAGWRMDRNGENACRDHVGSGKAFKPWFPSATY